MALPAALALVCAAGCVGCLVYLHLAPTGYSPLRNAVSEYGVGRYARWYQAQASLAGLAAIALSVALRGPARIVVLLAVFAAARLAITQAPLDRRRTAHWLLAVLAFGSMTAAGIRLAAAHHGAPVLGWTMLTFVFLLAISRRSPDLRSWFGLVERGFYAAMLAWLMLVSARLV